jgi:hypothetical protein
MTRAEEHGQRRQPVADVAVLAVLDQDRDRPVAVAARDHSNAGAGLADFTTSPSTSATCRVLARSMKASSAFKIDQEPT